MPLTNVTRMIRPGGVGRQTGVIVRHAGVRKVNVWGNYLPVRFADPVTANVGDTVLVDIASGATGQSRATVLAKLTSEPRSATGTIWAVGTETLTVDTAEGQYEARFVGSGYQSGDLVLLAWAGGEPYVTGTLTPGTGEPPPDEAKGVAPPPEKPSKGSAKAAAQGSGTLWPPGGWGSWAGGGSKVHQGSWAGQTVYGAWFYGHPFTHLQGRTITRIQFRLPARLNVGAYNDTLTVHLYAHTSSNKPNGDVNRVAGPFSVSVTPGQNAQWVDLPNSFANALIAGGGIAIEGNPYMGFRGVRQDRESGRIIIDWED